MKAFNHTRRILGFLVVVATTLLSTYVLRHSGWKFIFSKNKLNELVHVSENTYLLDLSPLSPRDHLFSLDVLDNFMLRHSIRSSKARMELRENSTSLTPCSGESADPLDLGVVYKKNRDLIFTTSDGSDPRTNGNVYALYIYPADHLRNWVSIFLLLMGFVGGALPLLPASFYARAYMWLRSFFPRAGSTGRTVAKLDIVFIVIFFLLLLLPLIYADFRGGTRSAWEGRRLAKFPPTHSLVSNFGDFAGKFDAWISDNIGFRYPMINALEYFYREILKSHYMEGSRLVLVGREGHFFNTGNNKQILSAYQGKRWLSEEQLHRLSVKLNDVKRYLDSKGIVFVLMLCPDKDSVYPEYYPVSVVRGPEPIPLDSIAEHLRSNTRIDVFSVKERLLDEKRKYLIYPKKGTRTELLHYNSLGAFFAYQELMKHIGAHFPELSPFSIDDVDVTYLENGSATVVLKDAQFYKRITRGSASGEFDNSNSPSLPVCLMLHDSYAPYFTDFLYHSFQKTIRHHWNFIERLERYVDSYAPDVVIFEVSEHKIPLFAKAVIAKAWKEVD